MTKYKIKEGNKYANGLHFGVHFGITGQEYRVRFSKECIYTPFDREHDWNKLCGWSYGMHHENSIRVCWRPLLADGLDFNGQVSNTIEICVYVYENGKRIVSKKTLGLNMNSSYTLELKHIPDIKIITLNILEIGNGISLNYKGKPSWGYRLYPYFGGSNPAPHDMTIELERL